MVIYYPDSGTGAIELFKGEDDFVLGNTLAKISTGGVARRLDGTSLSAVEILDDPQLPRTVEDFDAVCPEGALWY